MSNENELKIEYSDFLEKKEMPNNIIKVAINNIPNDIILDPHTIFKAIRNLKENSDLILNYNNTIKEDKILKEIKENLIFTGVTNIDIKENKVINGKIKKWANNGNEFENFNPNLNSDSPGVDKNNLIDPFCTHKAILKNFPCSNPKPCKNCTCGRANLIKNQEKKDETQENFIMKNNKGGCGRCNLGDEFRCANCPYRGMPAFEIDKTIKDKNESEKPKMNIDSNNTVKIDL